MKGEKEMTIKQISVFLENKPGKLAEFVEVLRGHGIDMRRFRSRKPPTSASRAS